MSDIRDYVHHLPECVLRLNHSGKVPCTCGLVNALAELEKPEKCEPCYGLSCPHWQQCFPQFVDDVKELHSVHDGIKTELLERDEKIEELRKICEANASAEIYGQGFEAGAKAANEACQKIVNDIILPEQSDKE